MDTTFTPDHPDIISAMSDLRTVVEPVRASIGRILLFGSTLSSRPSEASDIDFFAYYDGIAYRNLVDQLDLGGVRRRVVVQDAKGGYSNHPDWDREDPLALHLLLVESTELELPEKLRRTMATAVDVTSLVWASADR